MVLTPQHRIRTRVLLVESDGLKWTSDFPPKIRRASSSVPPLPTLNVMVLVHVRIIYSGRDKPSIDAILTTYNVIGKISSFKLNYYLELYQLRTCSMRFFVV